MEENEELINEELRMKNEESALICVSNRIERRDAKAQSFLFFEKAKRTENNLFNPCNPLDLHYKI